ncbi:5-carboxymethyl-2-hydroxymuconate isomerase [Paenibacillus beijingensis]|uniref:5-carboxymethyl-2-hydroxymuconate isomerase n=1 Tax=Paenibacillus beijingensis TaxID=1126833 RepID=A0A0D5NS90_9BACL|nr:5-carboxymethyl-2-hydroxymuconate isomerase [Paenibacillus beijingensis]
MEHWISKTRKIIGVGPNFKAFRAEKGITHSEDPFLFLKSPESLTTDEHIHLPLSLSEIICEVEMAVIIGKDAKHITEKDVPSIVAGYALVNDMTASAHFDTGRFKMFDRLTPVGPLVQEIDPCDVTLEMRVNGVLVQRDHTSQMLFSAHWLVSHISDIMTLREGDIILTGTPANPQYGKDGDTIELISPQLGYTKHTIHWGP